MKIEKILGFIFLFLGVGIILFSLYSGFQTFSGKVVPPQIFSVLEQKLSTKQTLSPLSQEAIQEQIQNVVSSQLQTLIPSNTLPKILNISLWSIFLGLLMFGGGQIASIGIKLLKQ